MENKGRKKFRNKVFAVFILISILPLLIVSLSSLIIVIKTRQQNIAELQNLAIETAGEKTNAFVNEKMELFNLVLDMDGDFSTLDPETRAGAISALENIINNISQTVGDLKEISFTDKSGRELVRRSGGVPAALRNIADEPQFQSAIAGDNYYGEVRYTAAGPVMVLASQIENKNRQIIGVISATADLKALQPIIGDISIGQEGYVYILDNKGNLITGYGDNAFKTGDNLRGIPLVAGVMRKETHNGLDRFETYRRADGTEVVFAGRPMRTLDWHILSEWPRSDAFSVIDHILMTSLVITALTVVFVIVLSLFMVRQITKPINSLYHAAKHISSGDFNYRLRLKTKDEFELLANKFNEMIKVLAENRKLRDEFVFIAAHELRTPVTAIRGYISMILENTFGEISKEIRENLLIVNQSNDRLVQLVSDLLEVARSEAGKMKIEIKDIPMAENVTTVTNELKSLAGQKGIKVSHEKPDKDIIVKADSYKLKEVLTNLIGNAIKYTIGQGDIIVKHEIKNKELITHISDHGIGMTPEEVEKLFGKFFRAQNDETKDIEGTGLGLFICKEIIERMGGKIWVTSEKGKGSTFSFSLRMA